MTVSSGLEDLLRGLAPQVLGSVLRRGGDFGAAEDAVQESLLAAATTWPAEGVPANPRGWLITVAVRRLVDWQRREFSRSAKEAAAADWLPDDDPRAAPIPVTAVDDSLALLFLCCHPALAPTAQVALTLCAVLPQRRPQYRQHPGTAIPAEPRLPLIRLTALAQSGESVVHFFLWPIGEHPGCRRDWTRSGTRS